MREGSRADNQGPCGKAFGVKFYRQMYRGEVGIRHFDFLCVQCSFNPGVVAASLFVGGGGESVRKVLICFLDPEMERRDSEAQKA